MTTLAHLLGHLKLLGAKYGQESIIHHPVGKTEKNEASFHYLNGNQAGTTETVGNFGQTKKRHPYFSSLSGSGKNLDKPNLAPGVKQERQDKKTHNRFSFS